MTQQHDDTVRPGTSSQVSTTAPRTTSWDQPNWNEGPSAVMPTHEWQLPSTIDSALHAAERDRRERPAIRVRPAGPTPRLGQVWEDLDLSGDLHLDDDLLGERPDQEGSGPDEAAQDEDGQGVAEAFLRAQRSGPPSRRTDFLPQQPAAGPIRQGVPVWEQPGPGTGSLQRGRREVRRRPRTNPVVGGGGSGTRNGNLTSLIGVVAMLLVVLLGIVSGN